MNAEIESIEKVADAMFSEWGEEIEQIVGAGPELDREAFVGSGRRRGLTKSNPWCVSEASSKIEPSKAA